MRERDVVGGRREILLYTARLTCSHEFILLAPVNIIQNWVVNIYIYAQCM